MPPDMTDPSVPLGLRLYRMTWPMVMGVLSLMSYQLVDSAFIGQLGVQPLAVVGFTIPVYQLIIGIQVGLGIATTSVIAMALGEKDLTQARALGALVIGSGFVMILSLCFLIWFGQKPILAVLGADPSLLPLVRGYWVPWLLSAWVGAMLYFGYSIFRANGYTRLPGMVMMLTSLLNVALDPLFIFVFDLGLPGAAWATVVAFGIGCLIVYPRILREGWICRPQSVTFAMQGIRRLATYMAPAMMSQFLPPLSAITATAIVAFYGENMVAAWGLGTRLEFFSIVIVLALTMALPPMIGRYRGEKAYDKIHELVRLAVGFVIVWQLVVAVFWIAVSGVLGGLLTSSEDIAHILHDYLWRVPLSYGGLGVAMITVSVSSAMGMPMQALLISALRLLACYLPALWLGSTLAGVPGLFIGAMIGNVAAGIVGWCVYKRGLAQLMRPVI